MEGEVASDCLDLVMDGVRALGSMLSSFILRFDVRLDRNYWICSDKIWNFCLHWEMILSLNSSFTQITGLTPILVLSSCFNNEGTSFRIIRNLWYSRRKRAWSMKFKTKTMRVRLSDSLIGPWELNSFLRDGLNVVISWAIGLTIFENCSGLRPHDSITFFLWIFSIDGYQRLFSFQITANCQLVVVRLEEILMDRLLSLGPILLVFGRSLRDRLGFLSYDLEVGNRIRWP